MLGVENVDFDTHGRTPLSRQNRCFMAQGRRLVEAGGPGHAHRHRSSTRGRPWSRTAAWPGARRRRTPGPGRPRSDRPRFDTAVEQLDALLAHWVTGSGGIRGVTSTTGGRVSTWDG